MATQDQLVDAASEALLDEARERALAVGYTPGERDGGALVILTEAFAKAIVDAVNYGGDPGDRMRLAIIHMRDKLTEGVHLQTYLRKGKPRGRLIV